MKKESQPDTYGFIHFENLPKVTIILFFILMDYNWNLNFNFNSINKLAQLIPLNVSKPIYQNEDGFYNARPLLADLSLPTFMLRQIATQAQVFNERESKSKYWEDTEEFKCQKICYFFTKKKVVEADTNEKRLHYFNTEVIHQEVIKENQLHSNFRKTLSKPITGTARAQSVIVPAAVPNIKQLVANFSSGLQTKRNTAPIRIQSLVRVYIC